MIDLLHQTLTGLQLVHGLPSGAYHRDIKPEDLVVVQSAIRNRPGLILKKIDFGMVRNPDVRVTNSENGVGTRAYMAPEVFFPGEKLDHRADIFSAGATFHWAFAIDSPHALPDPCTLFVDQEAIVTKLVGHGCPEFLARIIARMMQYDVRKRYQSVAEVRRELKMVTHDLNNGIEESVAGKRAVTEGKTTARR